MTSHREGASTDENVRAKLETIEDVLATTTDRFEIAVLKLLQKCEKFFQQDESDFEDEDGAEDVVEGEEFKDPLQRKKQRRRHHSTASSTTVVGSCGPDQDIILPTRDPSPELDSDSLPDLSEDEFLRQHRAAVAGKAKDTEEPDKNDDDDDEGDDNNQPMSDGDDDSGAVQDTPEQGYLKRIFNTPVWSVVEDSLYADPYLRAARAVLQGGTASLVTDMRNDPFSMYQPSMASSAGSSSSAAAAVPPLERDSLGRFEFNILWEDFQKWFAWHGASVANTFTVSRSNYHYKRGSRAGQVRMHYACCLNNKQQKKKHRSAGKITGYFQLDPATKTEGVEDEERYGGESSAAGAAAGKKRKLKTGASKITSFFGRAETPAVEVVDPLSTKDGQEEERPCKAGFTATKMVGVRQDGQGQSEVEYCHIVYAYRHNHPLDHHPVPGLPLKLEGVKERIKPKLARGSRIDRVMRRLLAEYIDFRPPPGPPSPSPLQQHLPSLSSSSSSLPSPSSTSPSSSSLPLSAAAASASAGTGQRRGRDDALTLADIFDLWYQLTLKDELAKAPSERDACRKWMTDLKKEGYITMTEKTQSGEMYGWTSKWQLELIQQHGGVLCLDRYADLLSPKAYMYTLLVLHHEARLSVPVAVLVCPTTREQKDLEKFFFFVLASMRTTLSLDYVPQGVLTYLGAVEAGALQCTFDESIVFPGAMYFFSKRDYVLKKLLQEENDTVSRKLEADLKYTLREGAFSAHYFNSMRDKARCYEGLLEHLDEHYLNINLLHTWNKFLKTNARYFPGNSLQFDKSLQKMLNIYPLRRGHGAPRCNVSEGRTTGEPRERMDHVIGVMARLVLPNYRWTLHPTVRSQRLKYVLYLSSSYTEESLEAYYNTPRDVYVPTLPYHATPAVWVRPASQMRPWWMTLFSSRQSLQSESQERSAWFGVDRLGADISDDGDHAGIDGFDDEEEQEGIEASESEKGEEDDKVDETEEEELVRRPAGRPTARRCGGHYFPGRPDRSMAIAIEQEMKEDRPVIRQTARRGGGRPFQNQLGRSAAMARVQEVNEVRPVVRSTARRGAPRAIQNQLGRSAAMAREQEVKEEEEEENWDPWRRASVAANNDTIQSMLDNLQETYDKRMRGKTLDFEEEIVMTLEASFKLLKRAIVKQDEDNPYY
ncbi:hypothetical protein BGZ73_005888 [Actinomortierella ambigua]|nr:hypothetical protein BGZ73_005888 [Actinomortierella ambigua]